MKAILRCRDEYSFQNQLLRHYQAHCKAWAKTYRELQQRYQRLLAAKHSSKRVSKQQLQMPISQ
jgi:hypothetical protein